MKRLVATIDANIDVVDVCCDRYSSFAKERQSCRLDASELRNVRRQLAYYRIRVNDLAELARDLASLVSVMM